MLQNKKLRLWALIGGVILLLIIGLRFLTPTNQSPTQPVGTETTIGDPIENPTTDPTLSQPAPSASPLVVPATGTVVIKGVTVQNFYSTSQSVDSQGTISVSETPHFSILFFPSEERFLISITGSPFETNRQQAETVLVAALNVAEQDACKLSVEITTPAFANPDEAGKFYPLSFCPGSN